MSFALPRVLVAIVLVGCTPQTSLGERASAGSGAGSGSGSGWGSTDGSSTSSTMVTTTTAGTTSDAGTSGSGGTSDSGGSSSESTEGTPFGVIGFRLADADADLLLGPLTTGDVVDPAEHGGVELSLVADTSPVEVGSVEFFVDDEPIRVENFVPYALGGNLDFDISPWGLTPGIYTVRAVPYELDGAQGEQGVAREVTFELL